MTFRRSERYVSLTCHQRRAERIGRYTTFGTDYPHQVHDMKGSMTNTAALPVDVCRAIREGNARRIFGI